MLREGLYEKVIDLKLREQLQRLSHDLVVTDTLDDGDSHTILAQSLLPLLSRALAGVSGDNRSKQQIDLCNRIIELLTAHQGDLIEAEDKFDQAGQQLMEILSRPVSIVPQPSPRPETPLSTSCLLTGTRTDPTLVSQLRRELLTSNEVNILCSFIKWTGIRLLEEELKTFTQDPHHRLRVITTSYMGATDVKAVEFLRSLPRTDVKVSYDTRRTRLHAKAYLFCRDTDFGTAYIGSSNISNAALTDGLEWNIKISQYESPSLWVKTCATFETYWNDSEFVPYGLEDRPRLEAAIEQERAGGQVALVFHFDLQPFPFQQEILDKLEVERTIHQRYCNLVVAATGTGKTVVAAFDYKRERLARNAADLPARLLFVAHREEILTQSLSCFRAVLRDQNFGELWVGGHRPQTVDHLFLSIQSYNAGSLWNSIPADHYDFIVIDEFHHAEAATYQNLLDHFQPRILLGLTATPERSDGTDVLHYFGGHISAEIRLATAINRKLLCPFQYFGITDSEDLSGLAWSRGGYQISDLENKYLGNATRAQVVVDAVTDKLLNPHRARGLGFCVSVRHAEFMAAFFNEAGIPAMALSANTPREQRNEAQSKLRNYEVNFLFAVDLYNEGVDIPEIDTVLFLRPTESLTVFLQQLGRGLRLSAGKECLTVLDFIGQANQNYNFEMRFRALMDHPTRRIDREIEDGCPHVPSGCSIQLEKIAQSRILDNITRALSQATVTLVQRIKQFASDTNHPPTLARFLDYYEMPPDDLYRRDTWSNLCVTAGLEPAHQDPDRQMLTKRFQRLAHINSPNQIRFLLNFLERGASNRHEPRGEYWLTMLYLSLWGEKVKTIDEGTQRLHNNQRHLAELIELLRYNYDKIAKMSLPLSLPYVCPLELYGLYRRDEVLGALGYWSLEKRPGQREGTLFLPQLKTDVFFVTLNKTEKHYSPSTMYEDYAISDRLFHWQSQSTTADGSATGKRYINHETTGNTILLFVREEKTQGGIAAPYYFLGPVTYESHTGSRPMSILWKTQFPIPAFLMPITQRLAVS